MFKNFAFSAKFLEFAIWLYMNECFSLNTQSLSTRGTHGFLSLLIFPKGAGICFRKICLKRSSAPSKCTAILGQGRSRKVPFCNISNKRHSRGDRFSTRSPRTHKKVLDKLNLYTYIFRVGQSWKVQHLLVLINFSYFEW